MHSVQSYRQINSPTYKFHLEILKTGKSIKKNVNHLVFIMHPFLSSLSVYSTLVLFGSVLSKSYTYNAVKVILFCCTFCILFSAFQQHLDVMKKHCQMSLRIPGRIQREGALSYCPFTHSILI